MAQSTGLSIRAIKTNGSKPLVASNIDGDAEAITAETHTIVLNDITNELAGKTGAQLIHITHWPNGAWEQTFDPDYWEIDIPEALMKAEYEERKRKVEQRIAQRGQSAE